jgi:hypothetical protein
VQLSECVYVPFRVYGTDEVSLLYFSPPGVTFVNNLCCRQVTDWTLQSGVQRGAGKFLEVSRLPRIMMSIYFSYKSLNFTDADGKDATLSSIKILLLTNPINSINDIGKEISLRRF